MRDNQQPLNEKSRSLQRAKRRKTNIVLNSLIVIVLLLITFVTVNIFFGNDKTAHKENDKAEIENNTETANALSQEDKEKEDKNTDSQDKETTSEDEKSDTEQSDEEDIEDQEIVTEGGNDPKVKKTIVNPAWRPVGTSQTGQHSSVYSGVDWDEMVQAVSYGTGIEESNMTILFLGNNGENKSVGTVKQKGGQQEFRVYIEWVDEEGWKPTLVEEMAN